MANRKLYRGLVFFIALALFLPRLKAENETAQAKRVATPVLLIRVVPGSARVYIDNAPRGKTSPKGRLKLSTLSPGPHQVRLAHRNFQDYEKTVQLSSGRTTRITAQLVATALPFKTPSHQMAQVMAAASPVPARPISGIIYIPVMHDHGSAGYGHCVGMMGIGKGMVQYKSTNRKHVFRFPLSKVSEAKRNDVYLAEFGAFHIKLVNGADYNFVVLNLYGQLQPPDAVLAAINQAMDKR